MKVITRFPPSPTGYFHIGSARTALFNYLFAAHNGGTMYLRFEDTDAARSKKEFEDDILAGMQWLNIPYEMPSIARQSERTEMYRKHVKTLLKKDLAYEAEPSQEGKGKVVRFRNPKKTITFTDLIRGDISFNTTELGDFVIAKNTNEPLYHLAVVIDDHDMNVTHVIRGEDHISNTPRQILILEALGFVRPTYAHIPLILAPDKTKLSKRHGAVSVNEYKNSGYLPEALINYLALLGWHPEGEQEFFSREELVSAFDLSRVQKSGAIFDEEKLKSMNQHWMRLLSDEDFKTRLNLESSEVLDKAIPLLKERARTFQEAREMLDGELKCLVEAPELNREGLIAKEPQDRPKMTKPALEGLLKAMMDLSGDVSAESAKDIIMPLADALAGQAEEARGLPAGQAGKRGRGAVLWPLRYALSGQERSPDPFTLIAILGKEESLARIKKAIAILGE